MFLIFWPLSLFPAGGSDTYDYDGSKLFVHCTFLVFFQNSGTRNRELARGEWAKPTIHSRASVLTWTSDDWGIHCHTEPAVGGSEYDVDEPAQIEEAIAQGLAYKAEGFE